MTMRCLSIAFASLTRPAVHRITPEAGLTAFTIRSHRKIPARLPTRPLIQTRTMPITLTARTMREMPSMRGTIHFFMSATITARQTLAQTRFRSVITPTARRIVTTLCTRFVESALRTPRNCGPTLCHHRCPLATLTIRKTRRVRVLVDAALLVLTPNTLFGSAIRARRQRRARRRTWQRIFARPISEHTTLTLLVVPMALSVRQTRMTTVQLLTHGRRIVRTLVQRCNRMRWHCHTILMSISTLLL